MIALTLRPATPRDWPAIAALLSENDLPLDGAEHHLAHFIVATDPLGDIQGIAGLECYENVGLLRSVVVRHRGSGLGRQLVAGIEAAAQANHIHQLILLTTTAEAFFSHLGWQVIDRSAVPSEVQQSVEFTSACPSTATVMQRQLP